MAQEDIHEFLSLVVAPVVVEMPLETLHELGVVITFLLLVRKRTSVLHSNRIAQLFVELGQEQFDSTLAAASYCGDTGNTGNS